MFESINDFTTDRLAVRPWHRQGPFSEEAAKDWLAELGDSLLVATLKDDDEVAAFLVVFPSQESDGDTAIRIGYVVAEAAWGQGIATELLQGFVDHLRETSPATLLAGVSASNRASIRVLEKCGFRSIPKGNDQGQLAYRLNLN